jgi:DNA repair exonuclease SbcCD ATPase subunit
MIIFTTLQYKNFLSVGDNEITINFNDTASTLIVGHNGSGKSLMLDALSFVLFGKPHRDINKPQLVNSINGKNCVVSIEFQLNGNNYRIVRGLKPNIFEIWQNGVLINQESHTRDYQKLLETNILKLNHKSFHQVVVLGSSNFTPFMQLSAHHRREVIEDLLDIGVFSKMNGILKENSAKLREQIRDTESAIGSVKEKIELQKTNIASLKQINENSVAQYLEEIETLKASVNDMTDENERLHAEYTTQHASMQLQLAANEKTRNTLLSYHHKIKDNIHKLVSESKFYENHEECPTCNQNIDAEFRNVKMDSCKSQSKSLHEGYTKLNSSLAEIEETLRKTQDELKRCNMIHNKTYSNQTIIDGFTRRIADLTVLAQTRHEDAELQLSQSTLDNLHAEHNTHNETRATQLDERMYNEVLAELLKDTGIKTKIIRQYLPVMNKLINHYLQMLDFFVLFNLDENFTETIKSRHRDDFTYSSFSEGEKQRIDLSLLFAWREIAKLKNSSNVNILILDEVFDASLDTDGVDNLLKIMNTLDADTRVLVISHKQDLLESKFDRKIEFQKVKNFTTVKEMS